MSVYTFDYVTYPYDTSVLQINIQNSTIIHTTLNYVIFDDAAPDLLSVGFENDLTATEYTELVNLVNNNYPNPDYYYQQVQIGYNAGQLNQGKQGIAIGNLAGQISQQSSIAIGYQSGQNNQCSNSVAIGTQAGQIWQGQNAFSLGYQAGMYGQGSGSVAVGFQSGYNNQQIQAVALGSNAGQYTQGSGAVAIGYSAGHTGQGANAVAIGALAGMSGQGFGSVAVGATAGYIQQSSEAVAIGGYAGQWGQGFQSVSVGYQAGQFNQGNQAVAIGALAGQNFQAPNSVVINASGTNLDAGTTGFFVAPLRNTADLGQTGFVIYNDVSKELQYITSPKTFVIDHPLDSSKYLVHACLEGAEAGVYYRGSGKIINNIFTTISLPSYASAVASNFTVHITPKFDGSSLSDVSYKVSEVTDNAFTVYGKNGCFNWLAIGERLAINVEPSKDGLTVLGQGPYTYIQA
jgi:hypothetical protein